MRAVSLLYGWSIVVMCMSSAMGSEIDDVAVVILSPLHVPICSSAGSQQSLKHCLSDVPTTPALLMILYAVGTNPWITSSSNNRPPPC